MGMTSGKYLAAIMGDTLDQRDAFSELDRPATPSRSIMATCEPLTTDSDHPPLGLQIE